MAYVESLKMRASLGLDVEIRVEADEFWSFVGDKSNQRWTWYAIDRNGG